jgi:hypothetical protein
VKPTLATVPTALALLALAAGCSRDAAAAKEAANARSASMNEGEDLAGTGDARCNGNVAGREVSTYDTSGDGVPDVRKVYQHAGAGAETRLVLICRETDLNADGSKDVVRYYDDEGRTLREDADRDFDGKMDLSVIYQDGKIVRKEMDENRDGKIDAKIFFENEKPLRAERDLAGRSTANQWRPDRWEYYEDGRMVRMGTDLDGDEKVDRWDRDATFKRKEEKVEGPAGIDDGEGEGEGGEADSASDS